MATFANRILTIAASVMLGASMATPASAADLFTINSVQVINTYSYTFGDVQPPPTTGGDTATILQSDQRPVPTSQLGVDYVGQATKDSFYFLHNDYCVGKCQISSSTTIRFEIEIQDVGDVEGLRFDSLITPGHLALVGLGSYEYTAASFAFTVSRTGIVRGEAVPGTNILYTANGNANISGLSVTDDYGTDPFRGTITGTNGGAGLYYDWSATPLSVELGGITGGERFYVDYTASYSVESFNTCVDILNCNAAQVVFGDPRTTGGGTDNITQSAARAFFASEPTIDGGVHAVITREYDASLIPYGFFASGSDGNIDTPAENAPITYVGNYLPSLIDTAPMTGVPEPTTWASMVVGFGVIGGALRRRRGGRRMAA
ncbi:hypothetical protein GCM10011380_07990 [Sphingomonas metalli]|uniref:Ice-binding protein C-terminal domain-containing protein n=1 Tax=Sphingomonas metalli TaxID=1779358 RepID=A0A916SW66_9SPHN|nr:PEPxxWA-CTERM sorting domain-containing protein [Sphingomonas metalli]GGB20816.1 hypothetical protein GCM10011380_07990 [Sphingomonas metalli]